MLSCLLSKSYRLIASNFSRSRFLLLSEVLITGFIAREPCSAWQDFCSPSRILSGESYCNVCRQSLRPFSTFWSLRQTLDACSWAPSWAYRRTCRSVLAYCPKYWQDLVSPSRDRRYTVPSEDSFIGLIWASTSEKSATYLQLLCSASGRARPCAETHWPASKPWSNSPMFFIDSWIKLKRQIIA
jgi:hypothetical protein